MKGIYIYNQGIYFPILLQCLTINDASIFYNLKSKVF